MIDLIPAEMKLRIISGTTPQQALVEVNQELDEEGLVAFEPAGDPDETAACIVLSHHCRYTSSVQESSPNDRHVRFRLTGHISLLPDLEPPNGVAAAVLW